MERYPSGQRGQTVNLLAMPSKVQILLSPPYARVAQQAERIHGKDEVTGSIPVAGSTLWRRSSDGQSMRFIPAVSQVQFLSPLPRKAKDPSVGVLLTPQVVLFLYKKRSST